MTGGRDRTKLATLSPCHSFVLDPFLCAIWTLSSSDLVPFLCQETEMFSQQYPRRIPASLKKGWWKDSKRSGGGEAGYQ